MCVRPVFIEPLHRGVIRSRLFGAACLILLLHWSITLYAQEPEPDASAAPEEAGGMDADQLDAGQSQESIKEAPVERAKTYPQNNALVSLADSLPEEQVRWLGGSSAQVSQANNGAAVGQRILALYMPQNTAYVHGAVMLLHDVGQHPDSLGEISQLRRRLPDYGWHTLSLSLTPQESKVLPERKLPVAGSIKAETTEGESGEAEETADESTTGESTTETSDSIAQANAQTDKLEAEQNAALQADNAVDDSQGAADAQIVDDSDSPPQVNDVQRIELGMEELSNLALQNRVLLGFGKGALATLDYLSELKAIDEKGLAVIWVNAEFDHIRFADVLKKNPSLSRLLTLDIYNTADAVLRRAARGRKNFANRKKFTRYRQDGIYGIGGDVGLNSQRALARIRVWLEENAPGEEVIGR